MAVIHVSFSWKILTVQDLQEFASNHPPCLYMGEETEVLNTHWNCAQLGCGFVGVFFTNSKSFAPDLEQSTGFLKSESQHNSQLLPPSAVSAQVQRQ